MLFRGKMKKLLCGMITAASLMTITLVFPVSASPNWDELTNLAVNGGLEEGQIGWETYRFNMVNDGTAYEGDYYMSIWGAGSWNAQIIPVEPNTDYLLHFAYKNPGELNNMIRIIIADGNGIDGDGYAVNKPSLVNDPNDTRDGKKYPISTDWTEVDEYFNSGDTDRLYVVFKHDYTYGYTGYTSPKMDDFRLAKASPIVTEAAYYGIAEPGRTLRAAEKVSDPAGEALGESEYRWQISDRKDGDFEDIKGANSKEYTVQKSDAGKYIRYGLIPKSTTDTGYQLTGTEAFSEAVLVGAASANLPIDLSGKANSLGLGTKKEAEASAETGAILSMDGLKKLQNESNALMSGDIAYQLINDGDKRVLSSQNGALTVPVGGGNYDQLHVLMAAWNPTSEAKNIEVRYDDQSQETAEYVPGDIQTKTDDLTVLNQTPIGLYGTGEQTDEPDQGYLYSYSFTVNPEKGVTSITFPEAENLMVFAVTGKQVEGEALKKLIETRIAELPEKITTSNREAVEKILSLAELYEANGGNTDEIKGYEKISKLFTEVKACTAESTLYDTTVKIRFTQPVLAAFLGYEMIKIDGLDSTQYEIEPIFEGEQAMEVNVIVANDFQYTAKTITLSDSVACAYEPNFTLGAAYKYTFTPEKLFSAERAECKVEQGELSINADLKNNSSAEQTYYLVCGVYTDENEMIAAYTEAKTLAAGETANIAHTQTVGENGTKAKLFIFNDQNSLKVIYQ